MLANLSEPDLLAQYLATHSPDAREKLVLSHVSLVHHVLGRLGLSGDPGNGYEDLVNQGLLGLIEAVDHYDPSYGTQFSTYATFRVRGKVLDYLRSLDWLSRSARRRTKAVQQAIAEIYARTRQSPTDDEIAASLGMDLAQVQQAMTDSSRIFLSLDTLTESDSEEDQDYYEVLADENQTDPSEVVTEIDLKNRLVLALQELPEREQMVLTLYYYEELTLKEIGSVLGISESRVCQLHGRAVLMLKAILEQDEAAAIPSPKLRRDRSEQPTRLQAAASAPYEAPARIKREIHV
ncbi:MAG: FliA/WhiG family RNA polymerase sigma factor [Chloroflexi bacterium]|nr:FliA/WhiG family RNA polymerase sigma factor [Chloroflexota bacterium]